MNTTEVTTTPRRWTAAELRKLPPGDRDAILLVASQAAEREYRTNTDLTAFEAFGEGDLHGDSSGAEAR